MERGTPLLIAAAVVFGLITACGAGAPKETAGPAAVTTSPADAVVEWRAKHESDYRRDWVSIAGLYPLKPGSNSAGSGATNDIVLPASTPPAVGRFVLTDRRVRFEPVSRVPVLLEEKPVTAPVDLQDDGVSGEKADELVIGDVRLAVHVSGGTRALRVWDPNGPLARGFLGFTWFPIRADYRVTARLIRDPQPRPLEVVNTYGDVDEYNSEGVVEFTLDGRTLRLRPFTTRPKRFYFVFRDASSGQETYETARFLYSDLLDDGTTILDFNQAYNPPCAFNPHTTCPIPLRENRLPVKILAGEKAYPVHVPLPSGAAR